MQNSNAGLTFGVPAVYFSREKLLPPWRSLWEYCMKLFVFCGNGLTWLANKQLLRDLVVAADTVCTG